MGFFMDLFDVLTGRRARRNRYMLMELNRHMEILNDCAHLMEKTVNPEVFFNHYDLYLEKLDILAEAESSGAVDVQSDSFIAMQEKLSTTAGLITPITQFIDRMWYDTYTKAQSLKTERGKQNRYKKFFETLQQYEDRMPYPCTDYYKAISPEVAPKKPDISPTKYENDDHFDFSSYDEWLNGYSTHHKSFDTWKKEHLIIPLANTPLAPAEDLIQNNLDGITYEKADNIDEAIKLYEYNVAHRFAEQHPYNRLAIIYRKQKKYDEEIRVLKTAIDVFTNDVSDERRDKLPMLEKFKARLEKAEALRNK